MLQTYQRDHVTIRHPRAWEMTEEAADRQRTITLQTSGASFWTLTLFDDRPDPQRLLDSVLQAIQDDYEEVDVYEVQGTLLQLPAVAADLDFVYLDLVNSVSIRAVRTDACSALVLYQGPDHELAELQDQFQAVTDSLTIDEELDDPA